MGFLSWELIHKIADIFGVLTIAGGGWKYLMKFRHMAKWIEGDHRKVNVLWRDHGYHDWNGEERRAILSIRGRK